jgi:hypothetical protein
MGVRKVEDKGDLRRFIEFPYRLYQNDPVWILLLRKEQWHGFDPSHNPMLNHCDYELFLLQDRRQVVGRVSVFVDRLALKSWNEPIGLFGSYECMEDDEGSRLLLEAARTCLREYDMKVMRFRHGIAMMWGILKVSKSGYYKWFNRKPSKRVQEEGRLEVEIKAAHKRTRETCGPERLQHELKE